MENYKQKLDNALLEIEELQNSFRAASEEFESFKNEYKEHNHQKNGESVPITSSIELAPNEHIKIGNFTLEEVTAPQGLSKEQVNAYFVVGKDTDPGDGSENTQITIEHQGATTGTTNQTFFYGIRAPIFTGTRAAVASGTTLLKTNEFSFKANELDGANIAVFDSANPTQFDVYEIASNTNNEIIVTGGTWTFTDTSASWVIFMPVYLGSPQYPWRRVYTTDGLTGGIRFGIGDTNGGQNGLLYMDSSGFINWRNPTGTILPLSSPGDNSELTIASGAVTATSAFHSIDTEADASSDDLDTINAGTLPDGTILVIQAISSSRTIVAKDDTGNLRLAGDFSLEHGRDTLTLILDGSAWYELSRSDNDT